MAAQGEGATTGRYSGRGRGMQLPFHTHTPLTRLLFSHLKKKSLTSQVFSYSVSRFMRKFMASFFVLVNSFKNSLLPFSRLRCIFSKSKIKRWDSRILKAFDLEILSFIMNIMMEFNFMLSRNNNILIIIVYTCTF